jgi:hypothetical protein
MIGLRSVPSVRCYCTSLLLTSTNTLPYSGIHTLLTCKVFKLGSRVLHHNNFYGRSKPACLFLNHFHPSRGEFRKRHHLDKIHFCLQILYLGANSRCNFVNHMHFFSQNFEIMLISSLIMLIVFFSIVSRGCIKTIIAKFLI